MGIALAVSGGLVSIITLAAGIQLVAQLGSTAYLVVACVRVLKSPVASENLRAMGAAPASRASPPSRPPSRPTSHRRCPLLLSLARASPASSS